MATGRRRQRRKDERPDEIAAAAAQVFAERGYAASRMEDIAARAGVAKGTVYLYFKTKQELFEAMTRRVVAPVYERMGGAAQTAAESGRSASEALEMVIRTLYRALVESPERRAILRILVAEGENFPELVAFYHREILTRARSLLSDIVERGLAAGEFRAGALTEEPRVLIGPAIMAAVWLMTFDGVAPLDRDRFVEAHVDLVLRGLRG